jgi:hypothetical protein
MLIKFLLDRKSSIRIRSWFAGDWRPSAFANYLDQQGNPAGNLDLQAALLAAVQLAPDNELPELRAHLRLWSGGNAAMQRTVTWLGRPDADPMPKEGLSANEARETLAVFSVLWDHAEGSDALRQELARRIAQIARGISGLPDAETAKVLEDLAAKLKDQSDWVSAYDAVRSAIHR